MDCSGTDDCNCNDCNYSDSESTSNTSRILHSLPKGAIPIDQYRAMGNHRANYRPPARRNEFPQERPLTISVPVFPLTNVLGIDSGIEGRISISILHRAGLVVFSWESFRGQIGARGINSLSLSTSLPYKPLYPITVPIRLEHNGFGQVGYIMINPKEAIEQVKFYFNVSTQKDAQYGDIIHINGGTLSYISNDYAC